MPTWTTASRPLSNGRRGTIQTLAAMSDLAFKGSGHPTVIEAAQEAVRRTRERDDVESMRSLLGDVRRRMRYTHDPLDTELVKSPDVLVKRSAGGPEPMDCDDASTLLASYLGAVGIRSRFVVVAANSQSPKDFSHVYVEGQDGKTGRWVPMDPIMREYDVGQEVPRERVFRRETYEVGLGRGGSMRGVSGVGCGNAMGCSQFMPSPQGMGRLGEDDAGPGGGAQGTLFAGLGGTSPMGLVNEWLNPFAEAANPMFSVGPVKNGKAAVILLGVGWFILRRKRR